MYAQTHTFRVCFLTMIKAVNYAAVACMYSGFAAYVMLVDSGTQKEFKSLQNSVVFKTNLKIKS